MAYRNYAILVHRDGREELLGIQKARSPRAARSIYAGRIGFAQLDSITSLVIAREATVQDQARACSRCGVKKDPGAVCARCQKNRKLDLVQHGRRHK